MRASDFQQKVLTDLATLQQQFKTLEAAWHGDDGFAAFKKDVKEQLNEEHKRITETHLRINTVQLRMATWGGISIGVLGLMEFLLKFK